MRTWRRCAIGIAIAGATTLLGAGYAAAPEIAPQAHLLVVASDVTHSKNGIAVDRSTTGDDSTRSAPTLQPVLVTAPEPSPQPSEIAQLLDEVQELQDEVQEVQDGQRTPWISTYGAPLSALVGALAGAGGAIGAVAYGKKRDTSIAETARQDERENLRQAEVAKLLNRRLTLLQSLHGHANDVSAALSQAHEKWLRGGSDAATQVEQLVLSSRGSISELMATKKRITSYQNAIDVYTSIASNLAMTLLSGPAINSRAANEPTNISEARTLVEQLGSAYTAVITALSAAEATVEDELLELFTPETRSSGETSGSESRAA